LHFFLCFAAIAADACAGGAASSNIQEDFSYHYHTTHLYFKNTFLFIYFCVFFIPFRFTKDRALQRHEIFSMQLLAYEKFTIFFFQRNPLCRGCLVKDAYEIPNIFFLLYVYRSFSGKGALRSTKKKNSIKNRLLQVWNML
jgi:hypothetical protein